MIQQTPENGIFKNTIAYWYKVACDGSDLSKKCGGNLILNKLTKHYVNKHCEVPLDKGLQIFVDICFKYRKEHKLKPRDLTHQLCDKYEVGIYNIGTMIDIIPQNDFVLFNKEEVDAWNKLGINLNQLEFMVCPSRNFNGEIDGVGLRLLDTSKVHDAFKWLFPYGQNCIFGANNYNDKQLYLVEGFLDMIALQESGYNAIGLGSAIIEEGHLKKLDGKEYIFCGDMDTYGILLRKEQKNYCFFSPEGKDPYEVFCKYGHVKMIHTTQD